MTAFKLNVPGILGGLSINDAFDPRKNPLLLYADTQAQYINFVKKLFDYNGKKILDNLKRTSEYNEKFFINFEREIPEAEWWHIIYLGEYSRNKTQLAFGNVGVTYKAASSLPSEFKTHWLSVTRNPSHYSVFAESLPSPYRELCQYVTRSLCFKLNGTNCYIDNVLSMISQNQSFEFRVEHRLSDTGEFIFEKGKIISMVTDGNRTALYKVFEYSTNVIELFGGTDRKWTEDGEGDVPLYGVELEVSTNYTEKQIVDAFPNVFAVCKKDSTISGNKSKMVEIVSMPASLRKHRKNWAGFFKNTNEDQFDITDKHNNGMHIHVSRKAFEDQRHR